MSTKISVATTKNTVTVNGETKTQLKIIGKSKITGTKINFLPSKYNSS